MTERAWIARDVGAFEDFRRVHWIREHDNYGSSASIIETAVCGKALRIPVWGREGAAKANWTHTTTDNLWALVNCPGCLQWGIENMEDDEVLNRLIDAHGQR